MISFAQLSGLFLKRLYANMPPYVHFCTTSLHAAGLYKPHVGCRSLLLTEVLTSARLLDDLVQVRCGRFALGVKLG